MPASALVRRVFIGLLVANLAVVGVKLAVGLSSGSLAVLGGAVDSCVDALNNVLALIVVRVAAKEPDEDHPYGHGKFGRSARWPSWDSCRSPASNWCGRQSIIS